MFCLFLTFGAFAETTETTPEAQPEYKSLRDAPATVHSLRELTNCRITYYNIGVYAVIGGTMIEMVKGDEATKEKFNMIANRANIQHTALQKKLNDLVELLLKGKYHPLEIRMILDEAQRTMIGIITQMIQDSMIDPNRADDMLRIMIEGTNKCDAEFLK